MSQIWHHVIFFFSCAFYNIYAYKNTSAIKHTADVLKQLTETDLCIGKHDCIHFKIQNGNYIEEDKH